MNAGIYYQLSCLSVILTGYSYCRFESSKQSSKGLQNQATEHVVVLVTTCPSSWYLVAVVSIILLEHIMKHKPQKSKKFHTKCLIKQIL